MAAYRCFAQFRYIPTVKARVQFGSQLEAIRGGLENLGRRLSGVSA